jgi:hypothetical protein
MMKSLVIAATLSALAVPVGAQTAPADPATGQTATPKARDPNRMICEKVEEIGTRLGGRKVCRTSAEWDAARRASKEQVSDWQQRLTTPGKPAG